MTRVTGRVRCKRKKTLTPIARWDVVPYQRIEQGTTLNLGVVAFSKYGINYVKFTFTDGTNTRSYISREMTLNSDSGVWEYWATLRAEDYIAGTVTCNATVWGMDGGYRMLEDLPLRVDSDGSLPQPEVWVSVIGGVDAQSPLYAGVGDDTKPYASITGAAKAIQAWNVANDLGNTVSGGLIRLNAGEHVWSRYTDYAQIPNGYEWCVVTPASGESKVDTKIISSDNVHNVSMLKLSGLTLYSSSTSGLIRCGSAGAGNIVWLHDCTVAGSNYTSVVLFGGSEYWDKVYMSDLAISTLYQPTSPGYVRFVFIRNCTFTMIGRTVLYEPELCINSTITNVKPEAGSTHANALAWSEVGGYNFDNRIIYGLRATGLHYSGASMQRDSYSGTNPWNDDKNCAFVNCYFEIEDDIYRNGAFGGWNMGFRPNINHFLIWHCSWVYRGIEAASVTESSIYRVAQHVSDTFYNHDYRGTTWHYLLSHSPETLTYDASCDLDACHFEVTHTSYVEGLVTNKVTGDLKLDASGVPESDSPLRGQLAPLVPVDLAGNARSNPTDIGAYEYQG